MKKESDILYENGDFWVTKDARGNFEIYKNGAVCATRHAVVGRTLTDAFERAKRECDRRAGDGGVGVIKATVLPPNREIYTVEYEHERYVVVVLTDHPRRLGAVIREKTNRECRKTSTRTAISRALIKKET